MVGGTDMFSDLKTAGHVREAYATGELALWRSIASSCRHDDFACCNWLCACTAEQPKVDWVDARSLEHSAE